MKSAAILAALTLAASAEQVPLRDQLREGLYAEEVTRDKDAAARQYEQILAQFDEQRPVAVNALFRLAELRRSQNKKEEAIALYQRVLSQFPDADPQADLSRTQLSALGVKVPNGEMVPVAHDPETEELQRLQKLAESSPDVLQKPEALSDAAKKGWQKPIDFLLARREASDSSGIALVMNIAAREGHLGLIRHMLARGVDPKSEAAISALVAASEKGNLMIVRALLEAGTSPDGVLPGESPKYFTPLIIAARNDNQELAKLLIDKGANVNAIPSRCIPHTDPSSTFYIGSALHEAVCFDHPAIVTLLLEHKANVNLSEPRSRITPLWLAAWQNRKGNAAMVKQLLDLGADPDAESADEPDPKVETWPGYAGKSTPLNRAIIARSADCVKLMLDVKKKRGAAVNSWMLYDSASMYPSLEITRLLLDAGADPNVDLTPLTPLLQSVAKVKFGKDHKLTQSIVELLVERGCKPDPKWESDGFIGTLDETRKFLFRSISYPKWAQEKLLRICDPEAIFMNWKPLAAGAENNEPPTLERWLLDQESKDLQYLSKNFTEFALYRKTETGVREIAVLRLNTTEPFPKLQWGDILEKRGVISSGGLFITTQYTWDPKVKELMQKRVEAKREPSAPAPR